MRSNDAGADLEESDDGVSTSEGSMPNLLIRKEHVDENLFEKEQEWENLSDAFNKRHGIQDANINKNKINRSGQKSYKQ